MNEPQTPVKKRKTGGRLPKVTVETALRIADRIASGMPLRYACALENPPIPAGHFEKGIESSTRIASAYDQRIAQHMERFLAIQNNPETKLRGMPASVWVWERRFPQFFAPPKTGTASVSVNLQTCIGLSDDIAKRARAFVVTSKPVKQLGNLTGNRFDEQADNANTQP